MKMARSVFFLFPFFSLPLYCAEYPLILALEAPSTLAIESIHWSPDEQHLAATTNRAQSCIVFDTYTGKKKTLLAPHTITAAAWVDSSRLVFGLENGSFSMHGPRSAPLNLDPNLPESIKLLSYCPQNRMLAAYAKGIRNREHQGSLHVLTLDGATLRECRSSYAIAGACHLQWCHSGDFLALATEAKLNLHELPEWGLDSNPLDYKFRISSPKKSASLKIFTLKHTLPVLVWDIAVGKKEHIHAIRSLAWSKDDTFIAVLRDAGLIEIYDLSKRAKTASFNVPGAGMDFSEISISHDNRYLAVGSSNAILFYDLKTGKAVDYLSLNQGDDCSNFFASFSHTIAHIAKAQEWLPALVNLRPIRITYAPLSPLIAVALKKSDAVTSSPHVLLILETAGFASTYKRRLSLERTGKAAHNPLTIRGYYANGPKDDAGRTQTDHEKIQSGEELGPI